jgi:hypothetical protein
MIKKKILVLALAGAIGLTAINAKALFFATPVLNAVLGSQIASDIAIALTGVGLGALIGQQFSQLSIPSEDDQGNATEVRLPLTPLTRDRPVSNPDAPSSTQQVIKYNVSNWTTDEAASCTSTKVNQTGDANLVCYYKYRSNPDIPQIQQRTLFVDRSDSYGPDYYLNVNTSGLPIWQSQPYTTTQGCPDGYTFINSACTLTNAQAIPDGKDDYEVTEDAFGQKHYKGIEHDPDRNAKLAISNGAAVFNMLHPDRVAGYPAGYWDHRDDAPVMHVAVDPSGGSTSMCPYQTCIPVPGLPGHFRISALSNTATGAQAVVVDVNSSSGVVSQAMTVPLAGQILSAGQTYTNAAGSVVTVESGQVVLANAAGGTYVQTTQAAAPAASINIPTDYARAGEASIAANTIKDKLAETAPESDLALPALENPLSSYFNPLRSWSVPTQSGTCPTGSFSWNDHTYTFDAMCQLFNENLPIIQGSMNVIYVLAALFIVLGA